MGNREYLILDYKSGKYVKFGMHMVSQMKQQDSYTVVLTTTGQVYMFPTKELKEKLGGFKYAR